MKLRSQIIRLCALIALLGARPMAAQDAPLAGFDAYVAKARADWEVPGLAIAIVKDDQVVFAKGYGVRKLGDPAQVNERTTFAIGSASKAFTAAALAMLVDEGKLKWDDPVTKHLKDFVLHVRMSRAKSRCAICSVIAATGVNRQIISKEPIN